MAKSETVPTNSLTREENEGHAKFIQL